MRHFLPYPKVLLMPSDPTIDQILMTLRTRCPQSTFTHSHDILWVDGEPFLKELDRAILSCLEHGEDPVKAIVGMTLDALWELFSQER